MNTNKPAEKICIYHSPDSDDAFMFHGFVTGVVKSPGFEFTQAHRDIQGLNELAMAGEIDVTAVSVHAYAHLADRYVILPAGASMGGSDYGPCLVAKGELDLQDGKKRRIAVPGRLTSAALATQIYLADNEIEAELVNIHFDSVQDAVLNGEVDAGVIIHEGQLTHHKLGLVSVLNLGEWWWSKTGLPLPLGINVAKRSLGEHALKAVSLALRESIEYSLAHRKEAIEYALTFGRGINQAEADKFIGMYVNDWTIDLGEQGRQAIRLFLDHGVKFGLIPGNHEIEFVEPK